MPLRTFRSSSLGRPGYRGLRLTCGTIRSHRPSSTSHGRRVLFFVSAVSHLRENQRKLIQPSFPQVKTTTFVRSPKQVAEYERHSYREQIEHSAYAAPCGTSHFDDEVSALERPCW